jgi:undecaprenyl-phosphate 4-deoxy-4-formamido-L-arabinose transferase
MMGLLLAAVGILGEYVGRIYTEVRSRPRYLVSSVLDSDDIDDDTKLGEPVPLAASEDNVVEVIK